MKKYISPIYFSGAAILAAAVIIIGFFADRADTGMYQENISDARQSRSGISYAADMVAESTSAILNTNNTAASAADQSGESFILRDGFYVISAENGKRLNVNADGAGADYEGIAVTLWNATDDVTQIFRTKHLGEGIYEIYAACSEAGYGRMLGIKSETKTAALYTSGSESVIRLRIRPDESGKYFVISDAYSENLFLGSASPDKTGASVILTDDEAYALKWDIKRFTSITSSSSEYALFPVKNLTITQGPGDKFSHKDTNAIDVQNTGGGRFAAPFSGYIVKIEDEEHCNAVWVQSYAPVVYADGRKNYMTVVYLHDNDVSDLYVGQALFQGEYFYDMGTAGGATGDHVHLSCFKGKYNPSEMTLGADGMSSINPWEALALHDGYRVKSEKQYDWISLSQVKASGAAGTPTLSESKW